MIKLIILFAVVLFASGKEVKYQWPVSFDTVAECQAFAESEEGKGALAQLNGPGVQKITTSCDEVTVNALQVQSQMEKDPLILYQAIMQIMIAHGGFGHIAPYPDEDTHGLSY